MATKNGDEPHVNKGIPPPPPFPSPAEQLRTRICNTVFKTGPLYLSSKGIGWTSWKKRWFILTRTSLVFFRSDPSVVPQRGSEVNLTLGGIDLNNSGSVSVKEDKKLLTVFFPDGRDGRTFTLKAETLQELQEWKTALESALSQSPSYSTGHNANDGLPVKVSVIGRPLLLALEDADGSPSFLEKALQFIEEHGVKVEGIFRQAADVDDVEFRVREYEEGKTEFSLGEDAHVIADCIKYVLREMPSPPIPASCCKALLQACRTERNNRVNAMRTAICETFPEPNRCLLQRILKMMAKVALHKNENRMNSPAVAACMAPLLLRPLLAGECEIESDFDLGGDSSAQLIQAAAAANHAQAIVITLLDEYDKIFGEGIVSPEPYLDSEESGSESAEETDESYEDDDESQGSDPATDNDPGNASSATCSESGDSKDNTLRDDEDCAVVAVLGGDSSEVGDENKRDMKSPSSSLEIPPPQRHARSNSKRTLNKNTASSAAPANDSSAALRSASSLASSATKSIGYNAPVSIQKSTTISNGPVLTVRNRGTWGRTSGRKNLSLESVDYGVEEEAEIQKLEGAKSELENKITEEGKGTAVLQVNMDIRKKDLHHRRQALEKEVSKLQDKLQRERSIRVALEAGLHISHEPSPDLDTIDEKTKADLKDIAVAEADVVNLTQKLGELGKHFSLSREPHHAAIPKPAILPQKTRSHRTNLIDKQNDNETSSPPPFETSISKDSHLGDTEVEGKVESSLSSKQLPQIQKSDSLSRTNYRSIGATGNSSNPRPVVSRRSSAKRTITTRIEGTVPTTTALTRLTTRLNFLKERRNQIAHELQNMDITRGSPRASQNQEKSREFNPNEEKIQESEAQAGQIPEKVENQTVRT